MRWKWVCASVVFLVVALMVTTYVVLTGYDYNKLKPQMARMATDAIGRELQLGGDVALAIGFSPTLVIKDAALANQHAPESIGRRQSAHGCWRSLDQPGVG